MRRRREGGYIEGTGRIQWGYSESTVGYSEDTVMVHWGTVSTSEQNTTKLPYLSINSLPMTEIFLMMKMLTVWSP